MGPRWSPAGLLVVQRLGCRPAPWLPRGPLPRTGGFPAGTEPLMRVLNTIRDLIPCEDPVILGTRVSSHRHLGVRLVAYRAWAPHRLGRWDTAPPAHIQRQKHHKYHCVKCFKDIFLGKLFFKHVEYTGNLQGNNAFKTLFFFKERIGIFIIFCFSK